MATLQKITPCLWFDTQAEEAAAFYASIFVNSRITGITYYGASGFEIHGKPAGSVMTVAFELDGHRFTALNGGPNFTFSEAISFEVSCETQEEIDYYWERLGQNGGEGPCGWLRDQYGLSWQVIPAVLRRMLADPDRERVQRVMDAVLHMKKLDVAALERAYAGE